LTDAGPRVDDHEMRARARASCVCVALAAGVGATAAGGGKPLPKTLQGLCGLPYVRGMVVQFQAADGARLVGAVAGRRGARVGVVLANTANGEFCDWVSPSGDEKLINAFVAAGYQVLLFDHRATGRSPSVLAGQSSEAEDKDVVAGAAELRRRGARRIVLAGGSRGGVAALVAAVELRPGPAAVVGLSPSAFPFGPITLDAGVKAARRLRVPLFLVVAKDDVLPDVKRLYAASASKDKHLLVVPGSAHAYFESDPSGPRVRAQILAFVGAHT
jgi:alpha-beta hydrolase superfamily lysophospholipase